MKLLDNRTMKWLRGLMGLIGVALLFDQLLELIERIFHRSSVGDCDDVDYVVVFKRLKKKEPRSEKIGRRVRLLELLEQIGLEIEPVNASFWRATESDGPWVYSIHAPYPILTQFAEEMKLKKVLKGTGTWFPFDAAIGSKFVGFISDSRETFSRTERQRIVLYAMQTIQYDNDTDVVSQALHDGVLDQVFPVSERDEAHEILMGWSLHPGTTYWTRRVADYLGTEIAFNFVWLYEYTRFLWIPSLLGIIVYAFASESVDDTISIAFASVMPILAAFFLEKWKRRSIRLKYELGVHDLDCFEPTRPKYIDAPASVPLTSWTIDQDTRRSIISIASLPFMMAPLVLTAIALIAQLEMEGYIRDHHYHESILSYLPAILFSIALPALNAIYSRIAIIVTNIENHRTESSFRASLTVRRIVMTCISSFMSLFYLVFWVQDTARVRQQLMTLMISTQMIDQLKEVAIPAVMALGRSLWSKQGVYEARRLHDERPISMNDDGFRPIPAIEDESVLEPFSNTDDDYSEMIVQFGYVFMFGWSWPLSSLCALLNNLTEIRTDCFKICMLMQKPRATSADSIGVWYYALQVMSIGAIVINTASLFMRACARPDSFMPELNLGLKLAMIVLLEHAVFMLKFFLDYLIPDIPSDIRDQMARQQVEFTEYQKHKLRSRRSTIIVNRP